MVCFTWCNFKMVAERLSEKKTWLNVMRVYVFGWNFQQNNTQYSAIQNQFLVKGKIIHIHLICQSAHVYSLTCNSTVLK